MINACETVSRELFSILLVFWTFDSHRFVLVRFPANLPVRFESLPRLLINMLLPRQPYSFFLFQLLLTLRLLLSPSLDWQTLNILIFSLSYWVCLPPNHVCSPTLLSQSRSQSCSLLPDLFQRLFLFCFYLVVFFSFSYFVLFLFLLIYLRTLY